MKYIPVNYVKNVRPNLKTHVGNISITQEYIKFPLSITIITGKCKVYVLPVRTKVHVNIEAAHYLIYTVCYYSTYISIIHVTYYAKC